MSLFENGTQSDPAGNFDTRAKQLAQRRKLAQDLIAQSFNAPAGQMVGPVYVANNPWGNFAKALGGSYMQSKADADAAQLEGEEQQAAQALIKRLGTRGTVEQQYDPTTNPGTGPLVNGTVPMTADEEAARRIGVMGEGMAIPSLRQTLQAQLGQELDYPRQKEKEQAQADRENARLEAQDARQAAQFGQQMKVLDARLAGQKELRQMPTIHVSVGGGQSGKFAGAATQVGVDARDGVTPVYRIGKTGEVFSFNSDGQPTAHEGAIAPKPAAAGQPTESERSSAGYLGRMEAAEKNLGEAKPFGLVQQFGLDKAPSLTNLTLSPAQQVQRQQQEDWVRAKLRKESGAVIGEEEMAREIRTYFPMAGDSKEVIRQKAQSRMQAQEQMKSSAGRAKPTEATQLPPVKPVAIKSEADWAALKSGQAYVLPDGRKGVK